MIITTIVIIIRIIVVIIIIICTEAVHADPRFVHGESGNS